MASERSSERSAWPLRPLTGYVCPAVGGAAMREDAHIDRGVLHHHAGTMPALFCTLKVYREYSEPSTRAHHK